MSDELNPTIRLVGFAAVMMDLGSLTLVFLVVMLYDKHIHAFY